MHWTTSFVLCTSILMLVYLSTTAQGFDDDPPRYNYDTLPKTTFTCKGKLTGRYYADAETDCQLFHVCVKMNARDVHDFKFLCPNGTTFDQEHQVCMDYFQVVCHSDLGTNPLGHIYELMKLSSAPRNKNADLEAGKISFVDPDVAERNTLGDDFQVDEYNNNRLASQNSLNYQSSRRKPSKPSDIFYKSFPSSTSAPKVVKTTTTTTTTTERPTTLATTVAPLLFRSPIPTLEPNSRQPSPTPRRPSLETFESYEIESVAGLTPQNSFNVNSFNRSPKNYDYSYETRDPEPDPSTTTTTRPIFHNTFRTPFPSSSSTAVPPAQTFQQQASRFNEDFFRKIPASTETSVSKAAQFYINSNTKYSTPEVRQPSTNPFARSTTEIPQKYSERIIPEPTQNYNLNFFSSKIQQSNPIPSTDRNLSNRGAFTFQSQKISPNSTPGTLKPQVNHRGFNSERPQFLNFESERPKSFSSKIINHQPQEDIIRPRSFSGTANNQNQLTKQTHVIRDPISFPSIPPPTTAEPYANTNFYDTTTTTNAPVTYSQKVTSPKDKSSIFFKSTTKAKDYFEKESKLSTNTVDYYEQTSTYRPTPTTTDIDVQVDLDRVEFGQKSNSAKSLKSNSKSRDEEYASSTEFSIPDFTSTFGTTTLKPLRRGVRRRINRPRQQAPKQFDPELKYSRRVETNKKEKKNEEILDADSSVYQGHPSSNLFQEEKKVETKVVPEEVKATTPVPKLAENFGRKIRVNTRREFVRQKQSQTEEPEVSTQAPRRLIKRLKLKTTTPDSLNDTTTTPTTTTTTDIPKISTSSSPPSPTITSSFSSTYHQNRTNSNNSISTLRPVVRINVKTKIGTRKLDKPEKDSEFRVPPPLVSNSKSAFSAFEKLRKLSTTSTTTPEPELVTASDEDILRRKIFKEKKLTTILDEFTTPTTYRPTGVPQNSKNSTSSSSTTVVVKVTNKQSVPTPISFKEPILSSKFNVKKKESKVEVSRSESVREDSTKSPDYDYAYYNSDDDYTDAAKRLEHKNYGKKPVNKKALSPQA